MSSEHDTDSPLDSPPTDFDHIVYESLDPPKQDDPLPFDSGREGLEQAAEEFSHQTKAERNVVDRAHLGRSSGLEQTRTRQRVKSAQSMPATCLRRRASKRPR